MFYSKNMTMENNIIQHRLAVQNNISKAFENDFDVDIEKGKWQIGMTKQYQGKTYKVGGFNAKGNPLWKLVKNDNGGGKSDDGGSKQQTQNQQTQQQNGKQVLSQKDYDAQKNLWSEIVSRGSNTVEEIEGKIKDVEKELLKLVNSTDNVKIETLQAQRDGYMDGILKLKNKIRKRIEALEYQKKSIDDDIAKLKEQIGEGGNTTQKATAKTQPKTTVSPQQNKNIDPKKLNGYSDVEEYAKSLNMGFKKEKSGWGKDGNAFSLKSGNAEMFVDFLNNYEYVWSVSVDDNGNKISLRNSSTNEAYRTDWDTLLHPEKHLQNILNNNKKNLSGYKSDLKRNQSMYQRTDKRSYNDKALTLKYDIIPPLENRIAKIEKILSKI